MELHDCLRACKKYLWLIALITAFSAACTFALSVYVIDSVYESRAMFVISEKAVRAPDGAARQNTLLSENAVRLFFSIACSQSVAQETANRLGQNISAGDLQGLISIEAGYDTGIFNVSARANEPGLSRDIVLTLTDVLAEQAENSVLNADLFIIDPPLLPLSPVSPNLRLNLLLAVAGGALAGMLLAIFFSMGEINNSDVFSLDRLPWLFSLGTLPKAAGSKKTFFARPPHAKLLGCIQAIRVNLQFLLARDGIKRFIITSPRASEGKSTFAVNLAASFADGNKRALLVDCNPAKPAFFQISEIKSRATAENPYREAGAYMVKTIRPLNFDLVQAPHEEKNIRYDHLSALLDVMEREYDLIILDCPAILAGADVLSLINIVRHAVILADYGTTSHRILEKSARRLIQLNANILGVVVNRMPAGRLL